MKYKGKRILIIGTSPDIIWTIPYFKDEGAYLFAISKNINNLKIKDLVDEFAEIDYYDIDAAVLYCKKNKIDAVISNSNEITIECCREINERIGNSFFYTKKQWDLFCNKENFLKLCESYKIKTPKTIFVGNQSDFNKLNLLKIKYPVVVKPVDSCGGSGCYKCNNFLELLLLAKHSFLNSKLKRIVVEEFLKGQEATITFGIQNKDCRIISFTDRYVKHKKKFRQNVHSYFVSPSKYSSIFENEQLSKFKKMILEQGLNNCSIFIQGFFVNNEFIPMESGLRFEGTMAYYNNEHFNKQDFRFLTFDNIIKVKTDYDICKDDYRFNGKLSFYEAYFLKDGKIGSIEGIEDIKKFKKMYHSFTYKDVGDEIHNQGFIGRLFACFNFTCNTYDEINEIIKFSNKTLKVKDVHNKNMIAKSINSI